MSRILKKGFSAVLFVFLFLGMMGIFSIADEITGGFRFVSPAGEQKNRWKVEGDKASFIDQNVIEISPVRATVITAEGEETIIKMPWARLNRTTRDVWSDASIEVLKGKSRLTGVGLKWNTQKKEIKILKKVRMEIDTGELKTWKDI